MEPRKRQMEKEQAPVEIHDIMKEESTMMVVLSPAEKLPVEMLDKLMTGLTKNELIKCRLVSKMWDVVAVSRLRKKKLSIPFHYKSKSGWGSIMHFIYSPTLLIRFLTLKELNNLVAKIESTNPSKSLPVTQVSFSKTDLDVKSKHIADVKTFFLHHGHNLTSLKLKFKKQLQLDSTLTTKTIATNHLFLWDILETAQNLNHLILTLPLDLKDTTESKELIILPHLKTLRIDLQKYHKGFDLILKTILDSAINLEEFNIYNSKRKVTFDPTYIDTFIQCNKFHVLSKYVSEACAYQKKEKVPGAFWIRCSNAYYPPHAFVVDQEAGGNVTVARCQYLDHGLIPGKFHTRYRTGYIPLNGREIELTSYEILVAKPDILRWIPSSYGQLVENAVVGGINEKGEILYIGRAPKNEYGRVLTLVPGKIEPSKRIMSFPWGGQEHRNHTYSILVAVKKPNAI